MAIRNIYLKIEPIPEYSPVDPWPEARPPIKYRRDCMRNPGHEDEMIPASEVNARRLTALVYREYLDPAFLIPKPDKIIRADVNEPVYHSRVPGTVIYAKPGDRLRIHVLNADTMEHSFHVHGLIYGIDSDGSWPLGTQARDGRRSDEICPGQTWTYTFDVTTDMIGAWPFHDHHRHIAESINRGLFGGIIVLPAVDTDLPAPMVLPAVVREYLPLEFQADIEAEPGDDVLEGELEGELDEDFEGELDVDRNIQQKAEIEYELLAVRREGEMGAHIGGKHVGDHVAYVPVAKKNSRLRGVLDFFEEWAQLEYVQPRIDTTKVIHAPMFLHQMSAPSGEAAFDIDPIDPGHTESLLLGADGVFNYHCKYHPNMRGTITVQMGAPSTVDVIIIETPGPLRFEPASVAVAPGGTVRFINPGGNSMMHSATDDGAGIPSYCFNGRTFVGNSPTIVAATGQRIRWYVFNLDVSMMWHNFHLHGQRWKVGGEPIDIRSIGPAESFVFETTAPPAILLPPEIEATQPVDKRPADAKAYRVRGDFLFHCHVEMHMMQGLAGLVRATQTIWLTDAQRQTIEDQTGIPLDPGNNECPPVELDRCDEMGLGHVVEVPGDPEVAMMHSCLVTGTNKVLYWGYTRPDQSRLWDAGTGVYSAPANQPKDAAGDPEGDEPWKWDMWSSEHAYLNTVQGTLLIHGGFAPTTTFKFDPTTLQWGPAGSTTDERFYSTSFTLGDGKVLTMFGSWSKTLEIYNPATDTWSAPVAFPPQFQYTYYPWAFLLPGGEVFIAGPTGETRRFNPNAPVDDPAKTWNTVFGDRDWGGQTGTGVILPLVPPAYAPQFLIAGGSTPTTEQTSETIDLSAAAPAWSALPDLNFSRPEQVQSVLLPDGRVVVCGGIGYLGGHGAGGPIEIFDPENPDFGWMLGPSLRYQRLYHSSAILLADGSVLIGGDPQDFGGPTPHERYYPSYYSLARPAITNAPALVSFGASITITTPSPGTIMRVVLMRPGAVTHGLNMSQRAIECEITAQTATTITVTAPPNGNVAPPGPYLLFIVDDNRIPSAGRWIRVS